MLWTMEAPARREATMTTEDHAREGVPVGGRPPPNLPPPFILVAGWWKLERMVRDCVSRVTRVRLLEHLLPYISL